MLAFKQNLKQMEKRTRTDKIKVGISVSVFQNLACIVADKMQNKANEKE